MANTSQMAWLIAFVSSVIAVVQTNAFPNYSWWTLVFTFLAIVGVTISVASDAVQTYQVAVCPWSPQAWIIANPLRSSASSRPAWSSRHHPSTL